MGNSEHKWIVAIGTYKKTLWLPPESCIVKQEQTQQEIVSLSAQQERLTQDKASYDKAIEDISQILHPFESERGQGQTLQAIEQQLSKPLKGLTTLSSSDGGTKASSAIDTFSQ